MSPAFPPPPAAQSSRHRERSTSGLAGPRAFLSGLRGKQAAPMEPPMQPSNMVLETQFPEARPPAARRAASAGHIQASGHAISGIAPGPSEHSLLNSGWLPGTPLPGPPPGPPPPGARSQSLNRYGLSTSRSNSQTSEDGFEGQHQRRAAATSTLGPVPPTPADWVDGQDLYDPHTEPEQQPSDQQNLAYQPLRINTGASRDTSATRRPTRRDVSAQGIRERRSRSRRDREPGGNELLSPTSDDSRPSDLLFSTGNGSISRRREHMRSASGYAEPGPRPSPPAQAHSAAKLPASILTPPYTPAVGNDEAQGYKKRGVKAPGSASSDRPVSRPMHTPNEDTAIAALVSTGRPPSSHSMKSSTKLDVFSIQALERHRNFIEKEAAATSDEERLELFANFMVHESRLRRDRYSAAYNTMAGDVVDLTRDMWRSYTKSGKRAITPSTSMSSFDRTIPSWASDGQRSAHGGDPSSASSFEDFTPATDVGSVGDTTEGIDRSESRHWAEAFKPSLSPIQSVAQSTMQDEDSSRGRAPSRWWEQSNSGSGSVGKPDRIEKTHRETKYMGIRASEFQEHTEPSPALSRDTATPGASAPNFDQGPGEYPVEKANWHEGADYDTPMATPAHLRERKSSTPGLEPLDVSRLVTLPPPYPRHHPAVSNSHPLLAELRSEHRALADHSEVQRIKDAFLDQDFALQQEQKEAMKERRTRLRSSIQAKVSEGSISYAEAAQAEIEFDAEEAERGKASARALFDVFEANVAQPLNTLLNHSIERATAAVGRLRTELSFGNQSSDPNQAQEEGDEQPERLEKLTLLKWLFESREQLHKEMFDLHAQRSERYSEVVLTPYRIQRAQAKIDEATTFFARDSNDRRTTFAKDSLKRYEELQQVMEKNVSRGVEDQLSAFWDIAPNLMEVTTRVPPEMASFEVLIPAQEYEENPAYHDHPLQYLYSLLSHAEKSAYQFIESQTNLLCLLHEVRTATSKSNSRLVEVQRAANASLGNAADMQAEFMQARREAEDRLTEDLKEKVGQVEEQWQEAIGMALGGCKEQVKEWLERSGGWEDGLDG
ncbi:hypothetical protein LTR08_004129 [Meristemomyces frigidus]|nr:hypothetical protein LTR08_004129 [Meristemomyces frigidus]